MTEPPRKPFKLDRIVAGLLALQWIVLPLGLLVLAFVHSTFDPMRLGISKIAFLLLTITALYFYLMLFGWICLRVYGGRRVGLIAMVIVKGLSLAVTASFVVRGRPVPFESIGAIAMGFFAIARLAGWGPRPT